MRDALELFFSCLVRELIEWLTVDVSICGVCEAAAAPASTAGAPPPSCGIVVNIGESFAVGLTPRNKRIMETTIPCAK